MKSKNKQILVVGDRLLIRPDKGDKTSPAGLYLPPSVVEKQEVKNWLKETEWAEEKNTEPKHIDSVISFLLKANLIKEENSKDYLKKLF